MSIRKPAVAGKFYPSNPDELKELFAYLQKKEKINTNLTSKNIIGGIVPHAGYIFSGPQAIHFFKIISELKEKYDTIVIINPNHTGYGNTISLDTNTFWETPLGQIELDEELGKSLNLPYASEAHKYEHSAEVMLPFLQYFLNYKFKILPICILNQTFSTAQNLAKKLYQAIEDSGKKVLIIASSDFSHYISPKKGKELDDKVIDAIIKLNSQKVEEQIKNHKISVCGYAPIMTLMEYLKLISPSAEIEILKRGHSGEVYPSEEVVHYVSMLASF